jgi:hypothetical protein
VVLVALNNRWKPGPGARAHLGDRPVCDHPRRDVAASPRAAGRVVAHRVSARVADARWYDRPLAWFLRRPWRALRGWPWWSPSSSRCCSSSALPAARPDSRPGISRRHRGGARELSRWAAPPESAPS